MKIKKKYIILFIISSLFIFLDQITKIWATNTLKGKKPITIIENYFHLKYVTNRGAAWGMFGNFDTSLRIPFFILITIIATAVLTYYYRKLKDHQLILQFSLAFIFAGMIGNFIDRVFVTFVVDFIDWHVGVHHWPTFNIADVAISTGMGLLVIDWILHHKEYAESEKKRLEEKKQLTQTKENI
jgi:signal peptidase II